jgi:hypothetical protein
MAMKRRKREDKSIGGKTPLIFFPSASYSVQHVHGALKFSGTIRRVNAIVGWPVQFRNWLTLKLSLMRSQRVLMTVVLGPFRSLYQIGHLLKLTMLMSQSISTREHQNLAQMQGPCGVDGTFHS